MENIATNTYGFARLEAMYDGYCFDRSLTRAFNPVSLGRCLDSAGMRSYWFEMGTPGWLMSYAKKAPIEVDAGKRDGTPSRPPAARLF